MVTDAKGEAVLDFDWNAGLVLVADGSGFRKSRTLLTDAPKTPKTITLEVGCVGGGDWVGASRQACFQNNLACFFRMIKG